VSRNQKHLREQLYCRVTASLLVNSHKGKKYPGDLRVKVEGLGEGKSSSSESVKEKIPRNHWNVDGMGRVGKKKKKREEESRVICGSGRGQCRNKKKSRQRKMRNAPFFERAGERSDAQSGWEQAARVLTHQDGVGVGHASSRQATGSSEDEKKKNPAASIRVHSVRLRENQEGAASIAPPGW